MDLYRATFAGLNPQCFLANQYYIAPGREPHHRSWQRLFAPPTDPPPDDASPTVKMAYKLQTEIGRAIYRLRKCTVEPVIGIIKEVLGFRQFSLRGLDAAAGEWGLVCLAFNWVWLLCVLTSSCRTQHEVLRHNIRMN
jgi:hypothetical protein